MDQTTLTALTALAEKLGTTAEYLWGVLLRQAPISGLTDLAVMIGMVLFTAFWAAVVLKKTTKPRPTKDEPYPRREWEDEAAAIR